MSTIPVRSKDAKTLSMEIDHRAVSCPEGITVLRAAELNGVFIPSLCSHKDLTPFGGCRLCMVEIEGMRGYPLACSTVVAPGMKVQTDTVALREMRKEILELILSEHPSSCLVCEERDACRSNQYTIRKAGVSTGCRYCPNDGQCELQTLTEKLGVTDIHYPVYYRGYEPEHDDPFFDRDYNICILCGRCVRMCQEVRGTSVLAFRHRGPKTQIGPAFGRNHVEAGCEFCGACVSVCPTGALADKASKWDGKPDGFLLSTCPFCAVGCQVELYHKHGRLSKVHPHLDAEINDGQLCVRGRFSLPEATHHHDRARKPISKRGKYFREVTWDEALGHAASRLKGLKPEELLLLVSPDLTNESLYAAQKLARSVLKSNSIDSTGRSYLPGGVGLWARLFSLPISIKAIGDADAILAVGLDSRFSFSVAGVQIRRALREGARLVTVDSRESNLARYTEHWLRPAAGQEGAVLRILGQALTSVLNKEGVRRAASKAGMDADALARAVTILSSGRDLAVVVGPAMLGGDTAADAVQGLLALAERPRTTFLPLYQGANTRGLVELGVFPEFYPGLGKPPGPGLTLSDMLEGRARPKVLYLVGETPFFERPDCDFVIAQDIYLPPFEVDVFLPASSFAEAVGTLTSVEGRVQRLARVEDLPNGAITGRARPDWLIFGGIASKLGSRDLEYSEAASILEEIHRKVPGFPERPDRRTRKLQGKDKSAPAKAKAAAAAPKGSHVLVAEPAGFRHRGIDLSLVVEGLTELALEEGFRMNPEDLEKVGVAPGSRITVAADGIEVTAVARGDAECPPGAVCLCRPVAFGGLAHRKELEPLYRLADGPVRVRVRAADEEGKASSKAGAGKPERKTSARA